MNNLEIKVGNKIEVDGIKLREIEGGFGENKKSILVNDIAEIHGKLVKHVNELINKNRKRFKDGVDIVDLKIVVGQDDHNLINHEHIGMTKMQFSKSKNIYILSERGYSKLLKIMEDDLAWELYDKLVDGYFSMRKTLKEVSEILSEEQKLQLAIFNAKSKEDAILASADLDRFRQKQIALNKPKVDYYNIVMDSKFLAKASDLGAKFDLSATKLNKILHNLEIIYKKGSTWYLYQKYKNNDYVAYPESEYTPQMKWTKKGVKFVVDLLMENGYELNNLNK